jgi:EmrB/QacA subfamily drug resistance transporter
MGRVMGITVIPAMLAPILGPVVGGLILQGLHWSWIFLVNVPVGVAAIAVTPLLLRESRAELAHRHFDLAGAATVTSGLMLLVYAMTRATSDGWGTASTLGLLAGSVALLALFIGVELRSPAPLLPLRIFRLRTLSAANVTMALVGSVAFSEFFLLTLYLQDVLHDSAMESGVAFTAFAGTVVVVSNLAQLVVGRLGVRFTLTAGLLISAVSVAILTRLPENASYFVDLFPAFVLGGAGMGLSFVPVTIASLQGVERADAGVASGLINTSRQIGGAIGLAAASAIAAASTSSYLAGHRGLGVASAVALDHGFRTVLYVLTGLLVLGAAVSAGLIGPPKPVAESVRHPVREPVGEVVEEAA